MHRKKTGIIIQARIGSQRLPGKVLMNLAGKPLLEQVIERCKKIQRADEIILATSDLEADNPVADLGKQRNIEIFRGSEADVLGRFVQAAKLYQIDTVVRICADSPLIDPQLADLTIERHHNSQADYSSMTVKRTYPKGVETEVIETKTLEYLESNISDPIYREHVTNYILENKDQFKIESIEAQGKLRRPDINVCVDTLEDFNRVETILCQAKQTNLFPYAKDIIEIYDSLSLKQQG